MFLSGNFVFGYGIFGVICCGIIAYGANKLNLIRKDSELLYLSLGFYKHFAILYLKNFFSALNLIVDIAINKTTIRPLIYNLAIPHDEKLNYALINATINLSAGLFCIESDEGNFVIHALDEKYYNNFDLFKVQKTLANVNDDNLV